MTEAQLSNAMDAYGSTVYRLALTRMQNIADAEDVYQEVFLRLWKQAADGTVTETGFDTERGNYLMIDHGDGLTTLYAACSKVDVNEGDPVKAGTPIAAIGSTGRSTGPHLHFEVRQDGVPQNPTAYFDADVRSTLRMG